VSRPAISSGFAVLVRKNLQHKTGPVHPTESPLPDQSPSRKQKKVDVCITDDMKVGTIAATTMVMGELSPFSRQIKSKTIEKMKDGEVVLTQTG
jgi:hypothetical protein